MSEEHEAKVKALREALVAGEESGPPRPFDGADFLRRMRAKQGLRSIPDGQADPHV